MVAKLKEQFRQTLQKTKQFQQKIAGNNGEEKPVDVQRLLKDLLEQTGKRREEYIKQVNILKDKFIQDSEIIRMGLEKLASSAMHRKGISDEKLSSLNRLAMKEMPSLESKSDDLSYLQAYEKHLSILEKEIIEILSGCFTK